MAVEECIEASEHLLFEVFLDRLVLHPVEHLRSIRQHTSAYVSMRQHAPSASRRGAARALRDRFRYHSTLSYYY
jgi:hypothetical protein